MPANTLLLIIGLLSTTCQIIFALSVHRLRLLLFSLAASILFLAQYAILGQWIGFYSGLAGTTYTLLIALAYKYPKLQHISLTYIFAGIYLTIFLTLNNWATFQPYQAIPLIGGTAILFALHSKNLIITKTIFIFAGALWLGYEHANTMYTQMLGEAFELIGNTIALLALTAARRKDIKQRDMLNIDQQALQAFTGAITLPTHKEPPTNTHELRIQEKV